MKYLSVIILSLWALISNAANLIPNSSFECGTGKGWVTWITSDSAFLGNNQFVNGLLTNDAFHGAYSMIVPSGARLMSRAIWLNAGNYKPSFYGKGSGTLPYGMYNGDTLKVGSPPLNNAVLSGTWTRFTGATFVASSNAFYWFKFGYASGVNAQVDAVQLESGTSATAYSPESSIECAISIPGTNNMYFSGDTPKFQLNFWNEGGTTNIQVRYDIYNLWNSNVYGVSVSQSPTAGTNSSSLVSFPSGVGSGWFKVVTRLSINDSADEVDMIVYPYPSNITTSVSGDWLGGHPHESPFHVHRENLANRKWSRNLSPAYNAARWQIIQPSTNTDFVFSDYAFTNWSREGMNIVCCLTPQDGTWNDWATSNGVPSLLNFFSNYCFMVANRVCNGLGLTNTYFEIGPNEPYQTGPTYALNVQEATNYAKALTYGIWGVTNAYQSAKIIGIAGAYGGGEWAWEVWTNLSSGSQAAISVISTHQYPPDNNTDPNIAEGENSHFSNIGGWIRTFNGIKPIWNTESGTYDTGPVLGLNGFWPVAYAVYWIPQFESIRSEWMNRQVTATVRILTEALRTIGYGMQKFFYYDTRFFNDASFIDSRPYPADYLQVDKPAVAALSFATHLISGGLGRITNSYVEMFSCTNKLGEHVVPAWAAGRTNLLLTATNGFFSVRDAAGNLVQTNKSTVIIRRVPQYISSTTLTRAQLSNTLATATVVNAPDTVAPNISIDIAPSGSWSGDTNRQFFKWTALDDISVAWITADSCTKVVYRYKIDGGLYSDFSQSNHVWIDNLAAGEHTFYVSAMDASGNASEKTYAFSIVPSSVWNTFGTLTVGTLTIGP